MLFFILSAGVKAVPLIGTCYHYNYRIETYVDGDYVDSTSIKSFRHGYDWYFLDSVRVANRWSYAKLADTIAGLNFYPPIAACMEPMFLLGFWHKDYMAYPGAGDPPRFETWKVAPAYEDSFYYFCYNLAYALKARLNLDWWVLHNEPDLYYDQPGWENWRSSPEDFAYQCLIAAKAIKDANSAAQIVFGGFANEDTTNAFIRAAVDSIAAAQDSTLIDYIDWHIYAKYSLDTMRMIAGALDAYCGARGFGWTVLETSGPPLALPVDENCPIDTTMSIRAKLIDYRTEGPYSDPDSAGALRDFLFDWCDDYEPLNLALPANKDSLENVKVTEFNNRIPTFVDSGAAAVHWFGAYEECVLLEDYDPPPDCWPLSICTELDAEGWVDLLIKRAEGLPLNIIDHSGDLCAGDTFENTPLSERMKEYIDSVWANVNCSQQNPRWSGDDQGRDPGLGNRVRLYQNRPDPFNASTEINYYLPIEMDVRLEVYNIAGQKVRTLFDEKQGKGKHSVIWDAGDLASGIYFCRLMAGDEVVTATMTVLK